MAGRRNTAHPRTGTASRTPTGTAPGPSDPTGARGGAPVPGGPRTAPGGPRCWSALTAVTITAAVTTLTGCSTAAAGSTAGSAGVTNSSQQASALPPGKYQSLPEPCSSVGSATLHSLLPTSSNYAGRATLTYDTDRRAGCGWSGSAPGGARSLRVDFERVVSYDPSVSDEDAAQQAYAQLADAAHVPTAIPSAEGQPAGPADQVSAAASHSASPTPPSPVGPTADAPGTGTAPRRLDGLGDEAFLDDALSTRASGSRRDITIVFRTANVLVTIEFSQSSGDPSVVPPSMQLQLDADSLAQQLMQKVQK